MTHSHQKNKTKKNTIKVKSASITQNLQNQHLHRGVTSQMNNRDGLVNQLANYRAF